MLLLLAPLTPHLSSECWEQMMTARFASAAAGAGAGAVPAAFGDVHAQSWPVAVPTQLVSSTLSVVIMMGKNRIGQIEVDAALKADQQKLQQTVLEVSGRAQEAGLGQRRARRH